MQPKAAVCDTNIVIDHIMGRSPILSRLLENNTPVHIPLPVWLESVFVLATVFHQTPTTISNTLSKLLNTQGVVAPKIVIDNLLQLYIRKPLTSIVDCFLIHFAKTHDLTLTTRDKKLLSKASRLG